jgi:hypothetical protein
MKKNKLSLNNPARINNLLSQIEEKYPEERIAKSRRKWGNLWNFEDEFRDPPIVLHRGRYQDGAQHPVQHTDELRENLLIQKLEDIVKLADINDDYLPVLTLDSGAYILAEAFGGERIRTGDMYMIEPFIHSEGAARRLRSFDPQGENHYMNMVFDTLRFFREATGGRIPINIHTPQGPLETLGCMWDSTGFYLALMDEPELVMELLWKILDAYIYYVRHQIEIIGSEAARFGYAMSYTHRPQGSGIGVGEDVIATIGPEAFRLTLPVYERIAEEFGPILLHSCGNPVQQLPVVMETPAIQGFHFSQLNAEDFMPRISRPMALHSRNDWQSFEQLEGYARAAKETDQRIAYQFQSLGDWMWEGTDWRQYDPVRMNEIYLRVKKIIQRIYG